MIVTEKLENCIRQACKEYKSMVATNGPDGLPGLLNTWTLEQYYDTVTKNIDEFTKLVLEHPFFDGKGYKSLVDVYEREKSLFLYCLQNFLNDKFIGSLVSTSPIGGTIEVNPETMEPIDTTKDEETENKKEFIKEVMEGVEKKKTLKDFLTDYRSYKQFRDDVERCLLYTDWEKIHRVMKNLKWKWHSWIDNEYNEHTNTVPSVFGIRENVSSLIKRMEEWIMNHSDDEEYFTSTGGFEIEMKIYDDEVDDYDHRVKFIVRFVVEQYDNGM